MNPHWNGKLRRDKNIAYGFFIREVLSHSREYGKMRTSNPVVNMGLPGDPYGSLWTPQKKKGDAPLSSWHESNLHGQV